jgi:hypothetical protein
VKFWYLNIFWKYVEKTQVSLKSDKNSGHFTWRSIRIFDHTLSLLLRTWNFSDKLVEKIKIHTLYSVIIFLEKKCRLWDGTEKMWYNRAGHRWQHGAHLLRDGYLILQKQTQNI